MTRHFHSVQGKSRTQQADAEKNDLNKMAAKHLGQRIQYGDPNGRQPEFRFVESISYHEMLNQVTDIQTAFNRLPARVRSKFHNEPGQMLRFVENPANYKEARKMGLIPPSESMEEALRREAEQIDLVDKSGLEGHADPNEEENAHKADPEAQPRPSAPVTMKGATKA